MNYPYRFDNPPLQEFSKKLSCYKICFSCQRIFFEIQYTRPEESGRRGYEQRKRRKIRVKRRMWLMR